MLAQAAGVQCSSAVLAAGACSLRLALLKTERALTNLNAASSIGKADPPTASGGSVEALKSQASELHDRLSDLHTRFQETAGAQQAAAVADGSPAKAEEWHREWHLQVKELNAAQALLRGKSRVAATLGMKRGAAAALFAVERAAGSLETSLSDI